MEGQELGGGGDSSVGGLLVLGRVVFLSHFWFVLWHRVPRSAVEVIGVVF